MPLTESQYKGLLSVFGPHSPDLKLQIVPDDAKPSPDLSAARHVSKYDPAFRMAVAELAEVVGPSAAARIKGVPQQTVSDWLQRYTQDPESLETASTAGGRHPFLTDDQERKLVQWVHSEPAGVTVSELCAEAQHLHGQAPNSIDFSRGWAHRFAKRHQLSLRKPIHRHSHYRATADFHQRILHFWAKVRKSGAFASVVNADETKLFFENDKSRVYADTDLRRVVVYCEGHTKASCTVLLSATADGRLLAPVIIFGSQKHVLTVKRLQSAIGATEQFPALICFQKSAWMDAKVLQYNASFSLL